MDDSLAARISEEARRSAEAALAEAELRITDKVRAAIRDAVELKYKVVFADFRGTDTKKDKDSKLWQLLTLATPVVLTSALGFYIWLVQTNLQNTIEAGKQEIGARFALAQEYQKRKVDVYQQCAKEMSELRERLSVAQIVKDKSRPLTTIHVLNNCANQNPLYISEAVASKLADVRTSAIAALQADIPPAAYNDVERAIDTAQQQMVRELTANLPDLSRQTGH